MSIVIIPTTPVPSQQFTIDLDGQTLDVKIRWNATAKQWVANFIGVTFPLELNGITLVTGVNILGPYAVRELGQLWVVDLEDKGSEPDFDNFGDRFQIMYVEK